ncbi:DEKNAAC102184 [Brettanomyces naardenensis]|uniref:DEKNAAC102184 n=1 Tax=Brettanomyces naardenensis TaxID=13370 RepID=A0A448YJW2_BRENA|nr:DEKNAAC102184 [Brettanomyces naardenensis]
MNRTYSEDNDRESMADSGDEGLEDIVVITSANNPKGSRVLTHDVELQLLNSSVLANGLPYTILKEKEKSAFSALLSLIGLCSSISMPIYWVALTEIQKYFGISEAQANLTVSAYLVLQAVSPVFVSSTGDFFGRRPTVQCCLLGGFAANVGLAVCNKYWLVIFLRCVLAAFVSPVISINSAIIGDFTTRTNRGGVAGWVSGFTLVGQGISPFLGSVFDSVWNWRAIFWFSAAFDAFVFVIVTFLLPETRRTFVGNLGIPPEKLVHKSPAAWLIRKRLVDVDGLSREPDTQKTFNPFKPFALILKPDILMCLLPCSIFFACWTCSQVSLTTSLSHDYHYTPLKVGLCFFAPGMATIFGTILSGKVLDKVYRRMKKDYARQIAQNPSAQHTPFNIIKARLGYSPIPTLLLSFSVIAYGWCLQKRENVAIILVLAFLTTFGSMYPLNVASTLLVDLEPTQSGGASSLNNLFRCGMSAIFVSCLSMMNQSMGLGGTYTFMGCICIVGVCALQFMTYKGVKLLKNRQCN